MPESTTARPLDEWREDMGDVLWWCFPITEAPYVGSPLDLGLPVSLRTEFNSEPVLAAVRYVGGWPGYHTHWTPIPIPEAPDHA